MFELGKEMAQNWNYMIPLEPGPQYAHGDGTPGAVGWADVPAALGPQVKTMTRTFWTLGSGGKLTAADYLAADTLLIDPMVAINEPEKIAADAAEWTTALQQVADLLGPPGSPLNKFDRIEEDGENGAYADYANGVHYTRAKLTSAGQAYYDANYKALGCSVDPNQTAVSEEPMLECAAEAQFSTDITNLIRQTYFTALKSTPATANAVVSIYNNDGFTTAELYGTYADWHPALWYYGSGLVMPEEPALAWQTAPQHLAGPNIYIDQPSDLRAGDSANHGLFWLENALYFQTYKGDQFFEPFVSAASLGGWADGRYDLRPDELLALDKSLVMLGGVRLRSAVFNNQIAGKVYPYNAEDYIYEAMTASYAQAVASNFESLYRSSRLAFSHGQTLPAPWRGWGIQTSSTSRARCSIPPPASPMGAIC